MEECERREKRGTLHSWEAIVEWEGNQMSEQRGDRRRSLVKNEQGVFSDAMHTKCSKKKNKGAGADEHCCS